MNRYIKVTAALAAFALLLVVMGLSTQPQTVEAQDVMLGGSSTFYICSDGCNSVAYTIDNQDNTDPADDEVTYGETPNQATHDNVFDISFEGAANDATVELYNVNLPRGGTGADKNPKTIELASGQLTVVAVHKSSGLIDNTIATQVKAFNGNKIQISYTPQGTGEFATIKNVIVDNVKPALVTNSPTVPLITKGSVDLTFSADITDGGSGFSSGYSSPGAGLAGTLSDSGSISLPSAATRNDFTKKGGIRLVVAGNVVALGESNFTKVDGGWRVSKTINSSAIQNISTNVPWYFEAADRANNTRRSGGSITGKAGAGSSPTQLVDAKFAGTATSFLNENTFSNTKIQFTRENADGDDVKSRKVSISPFVGETGTFTVVNTEEDALWDDALVYNLVDGDTGFDQASATAADGYQCPFDDEDADTNEIADCTIAGANYEIFATNLITVDTEEPTLVSEDNVPASVQTGLGYDTAGKKQKPQKNSIKVSFADSGKSGSDAPGSGLDSSSVTAGAFSVSGNTVEGVIVVRNVVYLTLADNLGSTEKPTVSIQSGVITDKAGNAFDGARGQASDSLGPNLTLSKSSDLSNGELDITVTTDEQLNALPAVWVTPADDEGVAESAGTDSKSVTQTGALTYKVTVDAEDGDGEFSVYASGADTANETSGSVGSSKSSVSPSSFTIELDNTLNNDMAPIVSVSDNEDVQMYDDQDVEQVDPMIVTVDFSQEGREYDRDSYRTVELTSAKLKITFDDGTSESKTYNLTTEVSSPNSVKFTIPMLNPKIGSYTLTVQARDSAGNTEVLGSEDLKASWEVVAPSPVDIALAPGWNLISLPFQPANPAINSVIPASHPADIVMTFDNASQVWLVSRRDAETGLFTGDIPVMTASTAYFIRTENFQALRMLRPPLATAAAAPPPPPAITVVKGWNLVPVVSNDIPTPKAIAADDYFGTLGGGSDAGWLKALTFDTLVRTWTSVTPGETMVLDVGDTNPCTGKDVVKADVEDGSEPCQVGLHSERSSNRGDIRVGDEIGTEQNPATADADDATDGGDGYDDEFDGGDKVTVRAPVSVGKGYWLYATAEGVIIP